ncbi:hypothetical protein [Microlunatus flavus]|uniref:Hpt domain-containing protein n=1 Tax=Microlunatus flavus TaxID=1036181 RepID=A0A1H9D8D9_9ACTN|nr:hypothetical protein [Microlunatus flavus]SEQ09720.1 Hpt domain-containing protein [Microlunatus flavus]
MTGDAGRAVQEGWDDVPVDGPETIAERRLLASFGQRAREVNLSRVGRLSELFDRADAGRLDEDGRREAENLAHQLVGSAGTFGQAGASLEAVEVERYFAVTDEGAAWSAAAGAAGARRALDRLRAELAR